MANVTVSKTPSVRSPAFEFDPYRMMRDMLRWDPFREMAPVVQEGIPAFAPAFEVKETKEGYIFKADVPGVLEKDLEITIAENRLTVAGKRETEKTTSEETYYCFERSYGTFTRVFTLPEGADVDHIKAELKDGVLTLQLPKRPEAKPKRISFESGKGKA